MPGGPRNQRFWVTIPRGVRPGQHFSVMVNNQQMMVRCPDNEQEGNRLIVTPPSRQQASQQYIVTVPPNVRPGQQFRVMINNQEVMVTCPPNVQPNQRITFTLPTAPQQEQTAQPNHQMFEVVVPDGVSPGQPFALIANNQRVMVTCPDNVVPGKKIRFELPVVLSDNQLESMKVTYDKDGWVRCLGQDLKYHWMYSVSDATTAKKKTEKAGVFNSADRAFIREISEDGRSLGMCAANKYAVATTIEGIKSVGYANLSQVANKSFADKEAWVRERFNELRQPWEEGHIKIRVRRSHLLIDAMDAFTHIATDDMRKIFRFEFIGEPGLDAGGVAREFYQIVSESLFNPDFGLFLYSAINQMCVRINPNSSISVDNHLSYFTTAGRLLGKALMDQQLTAVHMVRPLYKHIMAWPIMFSDLEHIDDEIHRSLTSLIDMDPDHIEMLYMDFTVTEEKFGATEVVELCPGGKDKDVTAGNLNEYLDLQLRYRLQGRYSAQLLAMLKGFYEVVPETLLSVFDFQELELLLHGLPTIDMDDWIANSDYTGEFGGNNSNHQVVKWYWEVVREMSQESKAKLLQFVTGTSGVPSQGFGVLQGNDGNIKKFTLHGDRNVQVFPRAHTCFNRIDLPMYKSKEELKKYMLLAISLEATGFGIE